MNISDQDIFKSILEKNLNVTFNNQVNNIYSGRAGEIQLQLRDERIRIIIEDNTVKKIADDAILHTKVLYLDGTSIVGASLNDLLTYNSGAMKDEVPLQVKLLQNSNANIVDEIIINKKLESIYNKIWIVSNGDIIEADRQGFGYKFKNSDKILHLENLSAGLKTFALLKLFLQKGLH